MVEKIDGDKGNVREKIRLDSGSRVNRIIDPYDKVRRVVSDILSSRDE